MSTLEQRAPSCNSDPIEHRAYLMAELRCAVLRAKLWTHDIEAVGLALKGGLVTPDQAVELLADCDCLHLIGTREVEA
jgi:hypothetical protein